MTKAELVEKIHAKAGLPTKAKAEEALDALARRDARRELVAAERGPDEVGEGVVGPDGEHDGERDEGARQAGVEPADQDHAREGERRVEGAEGRYGDVGDARPRREHVPARAGHQHDEDDERAGEKPRDEGCRREQDGRSEADDLVGHPAPHATDAEELRAAQPCLGDDERRGGDGPAEQAREGDDGIDRPRGRAREEALGRVARLLPREVAGGAALLLRGAAALEKRYLSVEPGLAPIVGAAALAHGVTPPPKRRERDWYEATARRKSHREKSGQRVGVT